MKSAHNASALEISRSRKATAGSRPIKANAFREEVCQVYDLLIEAGMEPTEAIRKTRSALKAINYPNVTYDYVMAKLRASGRLRKNRT